MEVDEQDSSDEVRGCVYNVLVTPVGHRDEAPAFGIPDMAHRSVLADLSPVERAVERCEPRVDTVLEDDPDYIEETLRRIRVLV